MRLPAIAAITLAAACGGGGSSNPSVDASDPGVDASYPGIDAAPSPRTVIVIPMENEPASKIYGNTTDAPYINGLVASAASATMFGDELPALPSEPHYVWMEAGANVFADRTFSGDGDPTATNATVSTAHLSTQLDTAGLTWKSYQEGITTGSCPIATNGFYAPKHDPFVFFKDVVGSPPSATNARCAMHHASIADLAGDVAAGRLANYVFITPNLCHDMHGAIGCPSGTGVAANIKAGDDWLAANLPPLIAYTHAHDATIFLVWDEGDSTNLMAFLAFGDHVVPGPSATAYTHSSQIATIEKLLGLPLLPAVASANDLHSMFTPGYLP